MLKNSPLFSMAVLSVLFASNIALAESDNVTNTGNIAVSQSNYKAGAIGFGGSSKVDGGVAATALWAMNMGDDYGVQLGGLAGGTDNNGLFNLSARVFKRNWEEGMLGLYGGINSGATSQDSNSNNGAGMGKAVGHLGLEGYKYEDNFNIGGMIGSEHDYQTSRTGFFDRMGVDYYVTKNFKTGIFQQFTSHRNGGVVKAEYLFSSASETPISVYGEVTDGKGGPLMLSLGMSVLFGASSDRSLQLRDRHDYVEDFIMQPLRVSHQKVAIATVVPPVVAPPPPVVIPPVGGGSAGG